jgi:hypothetical protein
MLKPPTFTAEVSVTSTKNYYHAYLRQVNNHGNLVTPAGCHSVTGRCRGCVYGFNDGICCGPLGYPWIEQCDNGIHRKGCGFCVWKPGGGGGGGGP